MDWDEAGNLRAKARRWQASAILAGDVRFACGLQVVLDRLAALKDRLAVALPEVDRETSSPSQLADAHLAGHWPSGEAAPKPPCTEGEPQD